jgi:hypothetical protein
LLYVLLAVNKAFIRRKGQKLPKNQAKKFLLTAMEKGKNTCIRPHARHKNHLLCYIPKNPPGNLVIFFIEMRKIG